MECNEIIKEVKKNFKPNILRGLTMNDVKERILRGEVNKIPKAPSRTIWQMIRANFFNVFNALNLILATLVIIAGSPKNAIFAFVIVVNSIIGVCQELNAKKTLEKLSVLSMANVNVIRDGKRKKITIEELVKDDIVCLEGGQQILADCELITGDELEIDESMLTGEADPVHKESGDKLYSGSFVVTGEGYAKVVLVGKETYSSQLAEEARKFKIVNSELQDSISKIIKILLWLIGPLGIILIFTQLKLSNSTWQEAIIGSVSGIIGMVPEGLVLLASATFIVSVVRLAKYKTLVQQLSATEILARVDTLCVDKTGTITEGKLNLVDVVLLNNNKKEIIDDVLGVLVNSLPSKNPTQNAILEKYNNVPDINVIEKVPFSSRRKWGGVVLEGYGAWVLGAPEIILGHRYKEYKKEIEIEASKGRRILLLAKVNSDSLKNGINNKIQEGALILIEDVIREEAPKVLKYFREEGVNLIVISGDNPVTVSAVAKRAGVKNAEKYIDARELPQDFEELKKVIGNYTVFGRVTPHQKKDIIMALKSNGHTVAMTGDGVNDVLALKESDCGIAMANGSEATKAVAQLVLMDSDFGSLPHVVAEGRKQIFNLETVAELFLSKTVFFIILSLIFCIARISFPISPIQSSLVGSCAIGIPAFFLSMLPYKGRIEDNFLNRILSKSIPNGLVMGIIVTIAYFIAYKGGNGLVYSSSVALFAFLGISLEILVKVSMPISKFKLGLAITMIIGSLGCCLIPIGRKILDLKVLEFNHWIVILVAMIVFYPMSVIAKNIYNKLASVE